MKEKKEAFVFFDIDGTVYSRLCGIPDSTREAIGLLKRNGHHPVVNTGRTKPMILPEFLSLGFEGILGGAGSYGEWQGEVLFSDGLSAGEAAELMRSFAEFGFHPYAEGADALYYDPGSRCDPHKEAERIFSLRDRQILRPYEEGTEGIAKVSAVFTEKSDAEGFIKTLNGRYHAIDHYGILLETFRKGSSKAVAIQKLMRHLGKSMEQTYAYGDSFNDLEMLETVRYGVCMKNGDPKLLDRIPLHAERIDEDGIYKSLKSFGLI